MGQSNNDLVFLTGVGFLPLFCPKLTLLPGKKLWCPKFCSQKSNGIRRAEKCCGPSDLKRPDEIVISLDIGTSTIKCAPYFIASNTLGPKKIQSVSTRCTGENGNCVTQSKTEWYSGVIATIRDVVLSCPRARVIAISVTGQMQNLIAIGEQVPSLLKEDVILYSDCRATLEAERLSRILNAPVRATGLLAKLSFVQKAYHNEKDFGSKKPYAFRLLFGAADFITYALSTDPKAVFTDSTTVSTTGLSVGPRHRGYDYDTLRRCGLGRFIETFPRILDKVAVVCQLSYKAAVEIGRPELQGLDIIHAGGDVFTTTVGAGCVSGKQSYIYAGTSGWIGAAKAGKVVSQNKNDGVFSLGHALDDSLNILVASVTSVGGSLNTSSRLLLGCKADELDAIAEGCDIGSNGLLFIPYLNGRRSPNPKDCTAGGLYGMRSDTKREHIARALIEGVLFSVVEASLQLISPYRIDPPKTLIGGVSRCRIFGDGLAALCGKGIMYTGEVDAGLLGAGAIAMAAKDLANCIPIQVTHNVPHSDCKRSLLSVREKECHKWYLAFLRWQKVVQNFETLW